MAIYHLHTGFVSRSSGRSAVQSAAYICGENLHEERRNKFANYKNRVHDVAMHRTIAPDHSKYKDLTVWNHLENFEERYADGHFKTEATKEKYLNSAQTASTIVVALPNELPLEAGQELIEKFIATRFLSRRLVTTYAIHTSKGNIHAHLQVSRRVVGEDGEFLVRKDREICTKPALIETRKLWADLTNEFLAREGISERITEKSFADLGIELLSSKHRGWYASSLENNKVSEKNLEIFEKNEEVILNNPELVIDMLNTTKATFSQRDILNEISKRILDEDKIATIFKKVLESSIYVGENPNGEMLYTGEKYKILEYETLSKLETLLSSRCNSPSQRIIESNIGKYSFLSEEQKMAIRGLCDSDRVSILVGKAGTGKTTIMKVVADSYKQRGSRVIGMSLSAVASESLETDADIESRTIASWSHNWRSYKNAKEKFLSLESIKQDGLLKQLTWWKELKMYEKFHLNSRDVIIVDEASMVGTSDWKEILSAAEEFGAKLILVGDDNQLSAIGAGGIFKNLVDKKCFRLNEIKRQETEWMKSASSDLSELNVINALEKYEHSGRIKATDKVEVCNLVSNRYMEYEQSGLTAVLCYTKYMCRDINQSIRELKRAKGEIGNDVIKLNERNFAVGDQVMFRQNDSTLGVKNGHVGVIKSYKNGLLHIATESGVKSVNPKEYSEIDHAYAMTLHKSQGKTFDNVLVVAHKYMDAKSTYVALTRHRKEVEMYYSRSEFACFRSLANSLSEYGNKDLVSDYENFDNPNKNRVYQYRSTIIEMVSVLKDINSGHATWDEYNKLKEFKNTLGKQILTEYKEHKLYLNQVGITKERLEISIGVRDRPLTEVELTAKRLVTDYALLFKECNNAVRNMKREIFNIKDHSEYGHYAELKHKRNEIAVEILENYPLHKEFVNQLTKEYGISHKVISVQAEKHEQELKSLNNVHEC